MLQINLRLPQLLLILCITLVAVQLLYFLFVFTRLAFYKEKKVSDRVSEPVSVIVCAHNERQNLEKLIPALLEQKHPEYEIIVVDDRSVDETYDYLKSVSDIHSHVKYVRLEHNPKHLNTKKLAIFLGVKAAKYDILLLTDADCIPVSDNWIQHMQQHFTANTDLLLGFSPYRKTRTFVNQLINFETLFTAIQYFSFAISGKPYMGVGRNLAYRKSLFLNNKGFGDFMNVTGGDDDLFVNQVANQKNTRICINREAAMESIPKETFSAWFTQKKRHYSVSKYYKLSDKIVLGIFMLSMSAFMYLFPAAMLFQENWELLGITFGVRILLTFSIYMLCARKLKENIIWYFMPFIEIVFLFLYPVISLRGLFTKKIQWT